MVLADLELRS
jgi:hypothetical protein